MKIRFEKREKQSILRTAVTILISVIVALAISGVLIAAVGLCSGNITTIPVFVCRFQRRFSIHSM